MRAWLKLPGEYFLRGSEISVQDDQNLKLRFTIPTNLPTNEKVQPATLIVDGASDNTTILPDAIFIKQDSSSSTMSSSSWSSDRPEGLEHATGFKFPYRNILVETIRNTFYHVSLWFSMFIILGVSVFYSSKYLISHDIDHDRRAASLISIGVLFGILGLITGSLWAKATWGTFWTTDVKLNMAAISMLIYLGYLILRSSIDDREQRATVSAAFAIFAFFAMIPLLFVVPRMTDSLHPGNGGNPGLGGEDLDHTLRLVFYPSIIGFTLLGLWLAQLKYRVLRLGDKILKID
jgi:heme exporter protein C